jgi:hypothetical protein
MDIGLYTGNYFDYTDDEIALEREKDIFEGLNGSYYIDNSFPTDSRSLYFDPLNPPKGSLPGASVKW